MKRFIVLAAALLSAPAFADDWQKIGVYSDNVVGVTNRVVYITKSEPTGLQMANVKEQQRKLLVAFVAPGETPEETAFQTVLWCGKGIYLTAPKGENILNSDVSHISDDIPIWKEIYNHECPK